MQSAQDLNEMGERLYGARDVQQAMDCFERAYELAPADPEICNNLAVCYWELNDPAKALLLLNHAIEQDPDEVSYIVNGAKILVSCGRILEARDLAESYLETHPESSLARELIQELLGMETDRGGQGEAQLDGAGAAVDAERMNRQGEALFEQGDLHAALAAFSAAAEVDAEHFDALNNLGVVHWQLGDLAKALDYLRRALELRPRDPVVVRNCAEVLRGLGESETAQALENNIVSGAAGGVPGGDASTGGGLPRAPGPGMSGAPQDEPRRSAAGARDRAASSPAQRLYIGCGQAYLQGWCNIDPDSPTADLCLDLQEPLPFPDAQVSYIYTEHLLEHLDLEAGKRFLTECRRVLRPGGILRVALTDLDYVIKKFQGNWRDQDWLQRPEYQGVDSRVRMLNTVMREWGNRYLYNGEELEYRLRQCGFEQVAFCEHSQSRHEELRNLETRKDSTLIAEAAN